MSSSSRVTSLDASYVFQIFLAVYWYLTIIPSTQVDLISPRPLLMTIATGDILTPARFALDVYANAKEPKQINLLGGGAGHFDGYTGKWFEQNSSTQAAFFKKWLLE